uniref:Protein-tyrosine-phosphatase n=1 Tax=Alexandrium monilatum TaxID=311494 RepID=A0A7S4QE25_9DINO
MAAVAAPGASAAAARPAFDCVLDGRLWVGPAFPAVDHSRDLVGLGISHVVNATQDVPCAFPDLFEYLRVPIADDPEEPVAVHLPEAFEFVRGALDAGGRVYIHCHAGVSRSGTIAIFCVMRLQSLSLREAYGHVTERRPVVQPNLGFFAALVDAEGKDPPSYSLKDYCSDTLSADFAGGIF